MSLEFHVSFNSEEGRAFRAWWFHSSWYEGHGKLKHIGLLSKCPNPAFSKTLQTIGWGVERPKSYTFLRTQPCFEKTLRAWDVIYRVSGRSQNSKAPFVSRHMFNWGAFCHAHRKRSMRRAHSGAQTDVWALGASLSLSLSCTKLWVCSRNCTAFPCIGKTLQGPWIERGPLNSRRLNCAGSIDFPGKKQQVHQDQPGLRCLMLLPLGIYLSVCVMLRFWPTPSLVPDSKAHTWPSTVQLFFYSKDLICLVSVLSCRFLLSCA